MVSNIIIFVLVILVLVLAIWLFKLKQQIKSISSQIEEEEFGYIPVSIELVDKDIERLTLNLNTIIKKLQKSQSKEVQNVASLRQSVADISHDMRTPLTSVIGYLQLVEKTELDNEQKYNISVALERANYCNELINEFFELSAIEADNSTPVLENIDISGVISELILANYAAFKEKGITPIFNKSDIPVFVLADKNMLNRVVQNLISNCIKYSTGNVVFDVIQGEEITFTVSNPCIEEANINDEHIFDKFYRHEQARNSDGAGIGLAIVKLLVEKMNGNVKGEMCDDNLVITVRFINNRT